MPFPSWLYRRGSDAAPMQQVHEPTLARRLIRPIRLKWDQRQLKNEIEYISYLSLNDYELRQYERSVILDNWLQHFVSGFIVLVGFFFLGVFLELTPMDQPVPILGSHFVTVGILIAWLIWVWPYLILSKFRKKAARYLRKSLEIEIDRAL